MSKTKSLVLQCLGTCIAFTFVFWWVGREYQKARLLPAKWEWRTIETPEPEPVKVYQGKWHKEGFLEVVK